MKEQIDSWLNRTRILLRPQTVTQYEYLLRHLDASAPELQPTDWTTARLQDYIARRREAGLGDAATKQLVCAMRSFFVWACGPQSPARAIPYPKIRRRVQRSLDADTMLRVMASCDTSTPGGARDLALVSLMVDTGLRAFEVCSLELRRLELERRRLQVVVKGGDEQIAVFSRTTAANLTKWLAYREFMGNALCTKVFCSIGGHIPGGDITPSGLRVIFRAIGQRAGLKFFSPHDLRRTFATLATRAGAPTRVVQVAGRWNDILMVERYTAAIRPEDFDRYSPVESLMSGFEKPKT